MLVSSVLAYVAIIEGADLHKEETGPLDANLYYAQQRGSTWEASNLTTAGHVASALGQRQDIGNAGRARDGTKEDEEWAKAARRAARDDLVVLGGVRDEDA